MSAGNPTQVTSASRHQNITFAAASIYIHVFFFPVLVLCYFTLLDCCLLLHGCLVFRSEHQGTESHDRTTQTQPSPSMTFDSCCFIERKHSARASGIVKRSHILNVETLKNKTKANKYRLWSLWLCLLLAHYCRISRSHAWDWLRYGRQSWLATCLETSRQVIPSQCFRMMCVDLLVFQNFNWKSFEGTRAKIIIYSS